MTTFTRLMKRAARKQRAKAKRRTAARRKLLEAGPGTYARAMSYESKLTQAFDSTFDLRMPRFTGAKGNPDDHVSRLARYMALYSMPYRLADPDWREKRRAQAYKRFMRVYREPDMPAGR